MAKEFDKNMFVMLLAIMIGVIIITFFISDIQRQTQIEDINIKHVQEIETIEERNLNFSSMFLDSLISFNKAQDDRMDGEINYKVATEFYNTIFDETNKTNFLDFKLTIINNCIEAQSDFINSGSNFNDSIYNFEDSKKETDYELYHGLCDLYVNLSTVGYNLSDLSYSVSMYLRYLAENLSFYNGTVGFIKNASELQGLFNDTLQKYIELGEEFDYLKELIEIYDLYVPER